MVTARTGFRASATFQLAQHARRVTNPLTTIKPMAMIYADGEWTRDALRVDFEDWDPFIGSAVLVDP